MRKDSFLEKKATVKNKTMIKLMNLLMFNNAYSVTVTDIINQTRAKQRSQGLCSKVMPFQNIL